MGKLLKVRFRDFILSLYEKSYSWITPIRYKSILLIVLGFLDHLSNVTEHIHSGNFFISDSSIEFVLRVIFIFCGFYGLLGNGKTADIRGIIVGTPYIYLAIYYWKEFISTGVHGLILPATVCTAIGLWTVFLGAKYERTSNNTLNIASSHTSKFDS